jgi:starch synthase
MDRPLSILFVSSEVIPFVKVGGIADVSFSLPLALRDIGHDIRVMLPKYGSVSERKNRIHEINRLRDIPIPLGKYSDPATVKSSSMNNPRTKVQAYITTSQKYFDSKKGIYENRNTGEPYPDNDERFIFFCRSVLETCTTLGWFPDIIHCNDWQTALIPIMAKNLYPNEFKDTKFLLTVHNFSQQGVFPLTNYNRIGLPESLKEDVTHKKLLNFLKAGLLHSDYVTTVSETYAEEMKLDKKLGNGLETIINDLKNFKGILNGIDTWLWNPSLDKLIKKKFENDYSVYKETNKRIILKKFNMEYDEKVPLIALISRLDEQKGIPLFIEAAPKIFESNVQCVLLGEGNPEMKKQIEALSKKYPDKFASAFVFDEELAHRIEAGCDIFLMPSQSESCGLNAIYSQAYGALPVVRETGGLKEIVTDIDEKNLTGNGFRFKNYKASEFISAINRAIKLYKNKEKWETIVTQTMNNDYSWKLRAKEYDEIYKLITK